MARDHGRNVRSGFAEISLRQVLPATPHMAHIRVVHLDRSIKKIRESVGGLEKNFQILSTFGAGAADPVTMRLSEFMPPSPVPARRQPRAHSCNERIRLR